jgi:Putative Actinobacterial Holin-X, holin superfamily III
VPDTEAKPIGEVVSELVDLTKAYAKQETVDPLKGVGRYLAYGAVGAVLLGIGVILLMLSALRALQTETGTTFTGNWSWVPYLIVLVAAVLVIGLALSRIQAKKQK